MIDAELLQQRGAKVCGTDHWVIRACVDCGLHYLCNEAMNDIYYDPFDLHRRFFRLPGLPLPPCRGCGALNLQVGEPLSNGSESLLGRWGWVFVPED